MPFSLQVSISGARIAHGAVIMTREESILAGKGLRGASNADDVGVELDAAIVEKGKRCVGTLWVLA